MRFKKNIVVWKLCFLNDELANDILKFKKNIVVWKLYCHINPYHLNLSLRRTLLYGNVFLGFERFVERLRRTLLYGNMLLAKACSNMPAMFKKNIVVWKLCILFHL